MVFAVEFQLVLFFVCGFCGRGALAGNKVFYAYAKHLRNFYGGVGRGGAAPAILRNGYAALRIPNAKLTISFSPIMRFTQHLTV